MFWRTWGGDEEECVRKGPVFKLSFYMGLSGKGWDQWVKRAGTAMKESSQGLAGKLKNFILLKSKKRVNEELKAKGGGGACAKQGEA